MGMRESSEKGFILLRVILIVLIVAALVGVVLLTRILTIRELKPLIEQQLVVEEQPVEKFINRYSTFLDAEKAEYICTLCSDFKVDPNFVIAILLKENPAIDPSAVGRMNRNGSVDVGLFQLNSKVLYEKGGYLDLFWRKDFPEFNASNWKHNSYIAVRVIRDLFKTFGDNAPTKVAAAYNCGIGRVFREKIPNSTKNDYVPAVMTSLALLQKLQEPIAD